MKICVYGASSDKINPMYIQKAEELGRKIAERGHDLVFGAGNSGCMGAAARGAAEGNGKIIGIAPSFFQVDGVLYEHCTEMIETDTMRERKRMLEEYSDCFAVTPGGIGTLDEFFEIITLKQLERHTKAIAILNVNGCYDDLEKLLKKIVDDGFAQEDTLKLAEFFTDVDEMLDYFENYQPPKLVISNMKHI
ncbi:MAG: TIGR00730 family Rossman fold protein [Clostridia bacterium]|nr:TIGR00730 family Rossman fold protein [Clostridia bacterium]